MQPSNVHDDFDDDNIICQKIFFEVFICEEELLIKILYQDQYVFMRSRYQARFNKDNIWCQAVFSGVPISRCLFVRSRYHAKFIKDNT